MTGGTRQNVFVFAGGCNDLVDDGFARSPGKGNAVYIVNAATGARIWWASGAADSTVTLVIAAAGANLGLASMHYAILSDLTLMDTTRDGNTDRICVGDTGGQVWRIGLASDMQSNGTSTWTGARLAVLSEDPDDATKPEGHRRFFYAPSVTRINDPLYSSAPRYDMVVMVSGNRADPLDKDVHDRAFGIRDYNVSTKIDSALIPLTAANLFDVRPAM